MKFSTYILNKFRNSNAHALRLLENGSGCGFDSYLERINYFYAICSYYNCHSISNETLLKKGETGN